MPSTLFPEIFQPYHFLYSLSSFSLNKDQKKIDNRRDPEILNRGSFPLETSKEHNNNNNNNRPFFFALFLVFLYPKIPNRGHNKTDTMNQTSPFQQCQHVGEENQHQSTSSFQLCWELQNQKWSFQGLKCKFWTKLLANIAQAILKKTADQVGVLINGVIDHFARKVKEDGELVIVSSVERSAWDWNNNYETENNPDEVCKEENYCSA